MTAQATDHSTESKERILEAALDEFGTRGYEGASTNHVCQTASISKGLLFHYYKSKQQLFAEVLERCIRDIEAANGAAFRNGSLSFDELCQKQLQFFAAHPCHYQITAELLINRVGITDPEVATIRERIMRLKMEGFRKFLKERELKPGVDPELALELMLTVTDYLQEKYLYRIRQQNLSLCQIAESFRQENRQVLSMLLGGIAVSSSQPE